MTMTAVREYYKTKSLTYRMSSTREKKILELFGSVKGKTILDVGCGIGHFGERVKAKGAIVVGIDISSEAVERARGVLDEAYLGDVENDELPGALQGRQFDIVILAEFLEHLFQPELTMRKLKPLLKPDGFVLITTPNFLLWSNRIRMFFGQFRYSDGGFLERGHIRFFTRPTLLELLREEGFQVERENNLIHPNWFEPLGKFFPNLFAYQLIVKVKPL